MKLSWVHAAAALFLGAVIHIAVVLTLPHLASRNAWARLLPLSQENAVTLLPAPTPEEQSLPYMAPDIRYAVCRYDLRDGPVRMAVHIPDELWMFAFYTRQGDNYYAITGGDIRRERVEFVISAEAQTLLELEMEATEEAENVIVVRAPEPTGLAVIRAPLRGFSHAERVERALAQATCLARREPVLEAPGPQIPQAPGVPPLPQRRPATGPIPRVRAGWRRPPRRRLARSRPLAARRHGARCARPGR